MGKYIVLIFDSLSEIDMNDLYEDDGYIVDAFDEERAAEEAFSQYNEEHSESEHYALVRQYSPASDNWRKFKVWGEADL